MSYARQRGWARLGDRPYFVGDVSAFGAVVQAPCGMNAARNLADGSCYCNEGFNWLDPNDDTKGCIPIDVAKPCTFIGEQRSPIDKKCQCPPGMDVDPRPEGVACIPFSWFPNCVDAQGLPVPGCFMGRPMKDQALAAGVGVALGIAAILLVNVLRKK